MAADEKNPMKRVANAMTERMRTMTAGATQGLAVELGIVTAKGIKLEKTGFEIEEYLILEHLTLDDEFQKTEDKEGNNTGVFTDFAKHNHDIKTPDKLKKIKVGDRVLMIPFNNGQEYIVVGRVIPNE